MRPTHIAGPRGWWLPAGSRRGAQQPKGAGQNSCSDVRDGQSFAPTISRGWSKRDVLSGSGAAQGHTGAREVNFGAAASVGADLVVLVEVQLPGVHDLPVERTEQPRWDPTQTPHPPL
jgi:hypothetical protein